jgi:hypothetical protein
MLPVLAGVGPGFDVDTGPADPVSRIAGTVADCGLNDALNDAYEEAGATKPISRTDGCFIGHDPQ